MTFALVLILGFLPVLGAQSSDPEVGLLRGLGNLLPESRDLRLPESSLSKASAGTLSGDADSFMSAVDWGSIENLDNVFVLGGVDEWGLSLGFAKKFGKVYLGASYAGDLIDEIYRRVTNKDVEPLWMIDTKNDDSKDFNSTLVDITGKIPDGVTVSNNDINLIVGTGIFGVRLGFSEYIRSVRDYSDAPGWGFEESLESSLKPNLELGFNIPTGKVAIKPSLRAAFDIHQFYSRSGDLDYAATDGVNPKIFWELSANRVNFLEPSAGLGIAVELALSDTSSMEFALEGEGALRIYPAAGESGSIDSFRERGEATDSSTGGYPKLPLFPDSTGGYIRPDGTIIPRTSIETVSLEGIDVTIPTDLRFSGAPSFSFTGDITERLTMGLSAAINGGFGLQTIEAKVGDIKAFSATAVSIDIAPDLALGASFHLIPDHFSLHAGLGLELFSFGVSTIEAESKVWGVSDKTTETRFGMPSARFGGVLTINLTKSVALDAMAFSSGLDSFDATKFNLLLTIKK
jgi:hypothetical protein